MASKFDQWGNEFDRHPFATFFKLCVFAMIVLFFLGMCAIPLSCTLGVFDDGANTIQKQLSPSALLKKYEWFKDVSAQLDKKQADIAVYEANLAATKTEYGSNAKAWPRDVREQYFQRQTELLGVKASFNGLAAEYNAAMAKANWQFTNVGELPSGATKVLPREYKPYEMK